MTTNPGRAWAAADLSLIQAAALLSGSSEWDSRPVPAASVPSFVMSDGPHGVRRQLGDGDHLGIAASEKATCFPTAATVANSWDPALAERMGEALGREARALGVDVLLGPGLNIKRSPLCGRNFEYYSEDPLLAGRMAAGMVRGIQSQGVAACPKHFAVNSQELRRMASDSVVDERTMREIYLTAFEIVVREASPRALMSSYNRVNGTYAHENAHLLTEILRSEWGFDGMVVSDWGGSNSAVDAARAGGSLEMPGPGLYGARQIVAAARAGELAEAAVRARAPEVLDRAAAAAARGEADPGDLDAHHELAVRIAQDSVVLLRNQGRTLPLAEGTGVGVVGDMARTPRYQGAGSSQVNPTRLESALDVLSDGAAGLAVEGFAQGYERQGGPDDQLIAEAVELASRCGTVLVCAGLDELAESEGLDRQHMRLPDAQNALIGALAATGARVVVVLSGGASVEMPWADGVDAIVHTYLGGQGGARAAVNVLTGRANPSGRLAETYARSYEDHPTSQWYPATGPLSLYREGPYVGYRYFEAASVPVAFPFGFGLSYSDFEYSGLSVDRRGARFTITNTSDVDGVEVAQLYARAPGGVFGPARQLRGFAKVLVPAGESREVAIPFDDYTFRHWEAGRGRWEVEAGRWTIEVGPHSQSVALRAGLDVEGGAPSPIDPALGHYLDAEVKAATDEEFAALLGRPVPVAREAELLEPDDPLSAMSRARSRLARFAARRLEAARERADAKGMPDLNILFVLNMPFRALAKMTRGAVSADMVDAVVLAVNGHVLRGAVRLARGYFANRRADKRTQRELDAPR